MTYVLTPLSSFSPLLINECRGVSYSVTFAIEVSCLSVVPNQTHRILGWHMDCLQPPLEEAPKGKWHCPMCPPLSVFFQPQLPPEPQAESHPDRNTADQGLHSNFQPLHASSDASTSYSHEPQTGTPSSHKGKGKAVPTNKLEPELPPTRRLRQRRARKQSRGGMRTSETEEEEPEIDSTTKAVERTKLRLGGRSPPPGRVVVRLKLPPKSKWKKQ